MWPAKRTKEPERNVKEKMIIINNREYKAVTMKNKGLLFGILIFTLIMLFGLIPTVIAEETKTYKIQ